MKIRPANILFYTILFLGFFLPSNTNFYIRLPGVTLSISETAFMLLPIINLFCHSKERSLKINGKTRLIILLYLIAVPFTEFILKSFIFSQSFGDAFKGFRIGIPLYSSLFMLFIGFRANIRVIWKTLLWAIGISIVLSIISLFIFIPIYNNPDDFSHLLEMANGRLPNSNAPFGIIGLFLLFEGKDKWYRKGKLVRIVSVLSIISLILTFNRTYLALIVLEFLYLTYKTFSLKTFSNVAVYLSVVMGIAIYAYNNNDIIQRQIDRRILSIVRGETSIEESTIEGNREFIYEGVADRIKEGYWFIGVPYDVPIFTYYRREVVDMLTTDTTIFNILLRYGFIPLLLFFGFFYRIYKHKNNSYIYKVVFILYFAASLNMDALMRHNSIFFLIILFAISFTYEKDLLYSQDRH